VSGPPAGPAEGNAARDELEHRPEKDDDALGTELAALRELIPGADIWYIRHSDGHVSWQFHLTADSSQHLVEYVLASAKDAEAAP
jgi:hypothetical protein